MLIWNRRGIQAAMKLTREQACSCQDLLDWEAVAAAKQMLQVQMWLETVSFSRLHDAVYDRACLGSARRIAEQEIFSTHNHGLNRAFAAVVIDFQPSVLPEYVQLLPLVRTVSDRRT